VAEPAVFESPVVRNYDFSSGGPLTLTDASPTTKWLVRGPSAGAAATRLDAPFGSSRAAAGGALVLGARPGEWIVVGSAGAVAEAVAGLDAPDFVSASTGSAPTAPAASLDAPDAPDAPDFVSALDWTHGRALFRVTGADASRMLEKVCSLDWSDSMTPDGAVASASVAKVSCDVARNDVDGSPSYLIFCDRSFGQYLFDALIDVGAEFGLVVGWARPWGLGE